MTFHPLFEVVKPAFSFTVWIPIILKRTQIKRVCMWKIFILPQKLAIIELLQLL